jgi:hypothetical protein
MSHAIVALVLVVVTAGWFLLALTPALREHFGRTDVGPLRVASAAADIRYFGLSFQRFVTTQLESLRARARTAHPQVTTLADGSEVWYAPSPGDSSRVATVFAGAKEEEIGRGLVVISESGLRVPDDVQVLKELYSGGGLEAGMGCIFRAILTCGDASLGPGSEVLRWVNTGGAFSAGLDSVLWGRASSWGTMSLSEGVRFQRIAAPRIEMGWPQRELRPDTRDRPAMQVPKGVSVFASRWVVDGDIVVPAGESIAADVIVSGTLRMGRGAAIRGAVRCDVLLAEDDCIFMGSVVATKTLTFGVRSRVTGPVVVEGEVAFGDDCRIGDAGAETTISAVSVRVGNGVVICGEVWARRQGVVAPLPHIVALTSTAA